MKHKFGHIFSGLFFYILGMPLTPFELGKKVSEKSKIGKFLETVIESCETHNR